MKKYLEKKNNIIRFIDQKKNINYQMYLIYQPDSGSFSVDLKEGDFFYEWFSIEKGLVVKSGSVKVNGGNQNFDPPFFGKAIMYLWR